jgi:DNA replication and repair protein RecF
MLQTLELTNFRSYQNGLFGFEPGVNIIVGSNASGKTNLLEAIHSICTLSGFMAADKDLIAIGQDWSRLEALTDAGVRVVKLQTTKPKSIEIDWIVKKRFSASWALPVVVFEPEHMLLLSNEPERRRSYLDGVLCMIDAHYKAELKSYKRSLAQRNRLLKQENVSEDQLFVWDLQLSQKAGVVASGRDELAKILNKACEKHYKKISKSQDVLKLSYTSKLSLENYSQEMLKELKNNLHKDRQRGFTSIGPHRDDLYVELKGSDSRITASRGETRSIILALKITELELLKKEFGKEPILLLDDVFSELDGSRRRALAEALKNYQTFLTTTDADVAIDHFSAYNIIPIS